MVAVRYYCPRCGTVVALERDAYLADKSVTPYPLEGWSYVSPDGDYDAGDADGVRFVCGESEGCAWEHPGAATGPDAGTTGSHGAAADAVETAENAEAADIEGCSEPFYLNFVNYEDGREVETATVADPESVELAERRGPRGPTGPWGPGGPGR